MKNTFLRLLISAAFIGFLFYLMRNNLSAIGSALQHANHPLIALATFIFVLTTIIFAKRLQLVFAAENIRMSLWDLVNLSFIGYFFNNFLPTSVGGDIVKVLCATRLTKEPVKSVTTILVDRIFGLFTLIVIPSVSLLFCLKQLHNSTVAIAVYSLLAGSLFSFCVIFNRELARKFRFLESMLRLVRLDEKVRRIYDGVHQFKDRKKLLFYGMCLSVAAQLIVLWLIYLSGVALGADTPMIYYFLLVPVVQLMSMLPSLNGLGIREGAYIYFVGPYMGKENAAALGIVWLGMLFVVSLIGGIIYLIRQDYHIQFKGRPPNSRRKDLPPRGTSKAISSQLLLQALVFGVRNQPGKVL